ncbi:hypothetical protein LIER_28876 [Lithospermum erythrorhizon]|uniref:Uncharacterized protein n=1 Tax=Lithospermum erythrorhizon TaxID=34254 RepID=A0AAV3RIA1_LITER
MQRETGSKWTLNFDDEIVNLLAKIQSFYSTICKVNWDINIDLLNSVGFFLFVELILPQSNFRIGQIIDWTEEVGMAERSRISKGSKTSRVIEITCYA